MAKNIIIYTTPTCPWCQKVKEFLKEKGVEYKEKDVSEDPKAAEEMIEKSGQMSVPVIDIDGQLVIGFDEGKLVELLS